MSGTVTPRPIAWIATEHDGIVNLAPFSYFIPLSSKPPMLIVAIGKKEDGSPKDTLANFLKGSNVTINFVSKEHKSMMKESSKPLRYEESEYETFHIPSRVVVEGYPPMVDGVEAAFFCRFINTMPIEGSETTPCLLEIDYAYYKDECIDERYRVTVHNVGRVGASFIVDATLES